MWLQMILCQAALLDLTSSEEISLLHDTEELLLIDLAIAIAISFVNHLLKLFISHSFSELLGHALQVFERDLPVSSSSNNLKALRISSFGSRFKILCVIIFRNSSYPMVPLPSSSTSEIIFWISSFLGSKPSARIATFSSLASISPEPSVSNRSKASLISCFCSSVSSFCFFPPALKRRRAMVLKERWSGNRVLSTFVKKGWVLS